MKNTLILLLLLSLFSLDAVAQSGVESKINSVKIFKQNAQITRDLSFTTTTGIQEIVLTGISTSITPSSLQVQFSNSNSILLSAKYENNYLLPETNNKRAEDLQKKLDLLNDELSWLVDKKNALIGMESILNKNQDLGTGNASFTAQQVVELSNSYQIKYLEIRKALRDLAKEEKPIREEYNKIQNQLNEVKAKFNQPSGNIILQISSKVARSVNISDYSKKN